MAKYVLYLSDNLTADRHSNAYGYWMGKNYTYQGEYFPITEKCITERTKRYSSKKRAENALMKILKKYAYVNSGKVEEVV